MDFPALPPRRIEAPPSLVAALGATPMEVWVSQYLVAILRDESEVRALAPDLAALSPITADPAQQPGNIGVTALADRGAGYDVVSRFFAPGSGIPEDPTTGSLHCILAPLFAGKLGRERLRFHQAYPGRGGDLVCELKGDRVLIGGAAVTVLSSRLHIPL
jgi:predicted PhzF superfamily epimerase YddE/YHI9